MIVGAVAAVIVGTVAAVVLLRAFNNAVRSLMQRVLGDYFDYAALFYVIVLTVVALLVFMYFVVPLWVWALLVIGIIVGVLALLEMT